MLQLVPLDGAFNTAVHPLQTAEQFRFALPVLPQTAPHDVEAYVPQRGLLPHRLLAFAAVQDVTQLVEEFVPPQVLGPLQILFLVVRLRQSAPHEAYVNRRNVPSPLFAQLWLVVEQDPGEHAPHPDKDVSTAVLELFEHPVYEETLHPPNEQSVQLLQLVVWLARYRLDLSHAIQKFVESFTQNATPGPLPLLVLIKILAFGCSVRIQAGDAVVPLFTAMFELICQFTAFCHAKTAPVSVDPSVPIDVLARVNVSETVIGISR